jgi:hypothetical protein
VVSKRLLKYRASTTYANNAVSTDQFDELVCNCGDRVALAVSAEVAQVTDMALFIIRSTVGFVVRVD